MAWLELTDLTRCFHITQAFENQSDGTKRSVSITLRFLLSMHIGSTQNLEIKSATFSLYDGKVSAW